MYLLHRYSIKQVKRKRARAGLETVYTPEFTSKSTKSTPLVPPIDRSYSSTSLLKTPQNNERKMGKAVKFSPLDPRNALPSRAEQDQRRRRKELEKEHGYGIKEPLLLTMLGIGLIWNLEKQVKDREKHKHRKELEEERSRAQLEAEEERRRMRLEAERERSRHRRDDDRDRDRDREPRRRRRGYSGSGSASGSGSRSITLSSDSSADESATGEDYDHGQRRQHNTRDPSNGRASSRSYSRDVRGRPRWYDDRYDEIRSGRFDDRKVTRAQSTERRSRRDSF